MTVAWNLTKEQIKTIAACVWEDIASFIEEHPKEYTQYLNTTEIAQKEGVAYVV